jgi:hypothetical protein
MGTKQTFRREVATSVDDPACVKTPTRGERENGFLSFLVLTARARVVLFYFDLIETNILRESSTSEFSQSLDPKLTLCSIVVMFASW